MVKAVLTILRSQWDRAAAVVAIVVAALALINGYVGVSGTSLVTEQLPYILSGGLVGVFLVGMAATLWLSADLRDEWRKLDRVERGLEEMRRLLHETGGSDTGSVSS